MIDLALINGRVMTDEGLSPGAAVGVVDGRIVYVGLQSGLPPARRRRDLEDALLLPGFIDTQVNGGGGVLFNEDPSPEGIAAIAAAHRRYGTTGYLPTLISDHLDVVTLGVDAVNQAMARGAPGLLGVHLEGPFLNPARKGIHDLSRIQKLDASLVPTLRKLSRGKTLMTLAPETVEPELIKALAASGIIVSAGHSDATYEQAKAALAGGVTGFTHLFNAMSPLSARAPGMVGAALENQTAWSGIIVDGHHVAPATLKIALKCRPRAKFMLVTDAMPCVGSGQDHFILNGKRITVLDGLCFDDNGTLAGSSLDMASAVRNAQSLLGLDLAEASRMASLYPAAFLGLDRELGRIAVGFRASLVAADDDLDVKATWIDGLEEEEQALRADAAR